jgi:quercetin dioxygenase-like cupin family protein
MTRKEGSVLPVLKSDKNDFKKVSDGIYRKLIHTDHLMVAAIDFVDGPWDEAMPRHSHHHEQASYVAEGEIVFYCEDEPDQHLKAGDMFAAPSGKQHTIKILTKRVRIIDSFHPIREDFL